MLGKLYGSWNGWKAKVIVEMAGYGDAVFIRFGPSERAPGVQQAYNMGVCVRT